MPWLWPAFLSGRSRYWVLVVLLICLNLAMAQMWNLLAGYSGLISLGQQAFVGLGGYTLAVFSMYYGFPIWLSILIGGAISVLFALLISRAHLQNAGGLLCHRNMDRR